MPEGDVVLVTVKGHLNSQKWQTGFHVQYKSGAATAEDLADDVMTTVIPAMVAASCSGVLFETVRIFDTNPAGVISLEVAAADNLVGTLTGTALPGQVPILFDVLGGRKGRRARGRQFYPGGATAHAAAGKITSASLTALNTLAGTLNGRYAIGGSATATYQGVIYSPADATFRNKKGVQTRLGTVITDITAWKVNEFLKTLHRRAIGVGE